MARAVRWDLIADSRRYTKGFKEAERTTKQFHGFVTKTAGLIGGAFAAVQVGGFLKDAIGEAREAAKVGRQTAAVIKATGGVANVTAKDVDRLADSLSKKVGVDDEVIAAGQNMLLTFKGVKNSAGEQNKIFDQTTKIAVDMAAALNQGEVSQSNLEQTTMRLGKALNDPIKGISALTRVGVTFTENQKEQIKTLVESGRTMDAQKIILRELTSEFGGAAEAAADPWAKLQVAFGNLKESIGKVLLPAFNRAATFITDTFIPAVEKWWKEHAPKVREAFRKISGVIDDVVGKIRDDLLPALGELSTFFDKELTPAIEGNKKAWQDNKDAIFGLKVETKNSGNVFKQVAAFLGSVMAKQVERVTILVGLAARAFRLWWSLGGRAVRLLADLVFAAGIRILQAFQGVVNSIPGGKNSGWGRALSRGIDQLSGFRRDFNAQMDALKDENVKVTAQGVWVPPKGLGSLHSIVGAASGGPISGPGTSTSDSIPAMLSTGEHVLSAREVRGMGGHRAVEAMRRQARGFAAGGAVHPQLGLPSAAGFGVAIGRSIDRLAAAIDRLTVKVPIQGANIPHVAGAWRLALDFLSAAGIPHNAISTFRPGARTRASGSVSYHALNRAVDITGPNMLAIWQALTGTNPTELIYSRAPFYKSRSGWHPISRLDPITRADHFSHVHAAYRRGGRIPEDVFGVGRSGRTYGFHGGETVVPKGQATINVTVNVSGAVGNTREVAERLAPEIYTSLKRVAERNGNTRLAAVLR